MQRVDVETDDHELLTTAFANGQHQTVIMLNRAAVAAKVAVRGNSKHWLQMERTGLEENNLVSAVPGEVVVQPGEIVVLSTVIAEK